MAGIYLQPSKSLSGKIFEHGDASNEGGPDVGSKEEAPEYNMEESSHLRWEEFSAARCYDYSSRNPSKPDLQEECSKLGQPTFTEETQVIQPSE
jgi:hypothetical protein